MGHEDMDLYRSSSLGAIPIFVRIPNMNQCHDPIETARPLPSELVGISRTSQDARRFLPFLSQQREDSRPTKHCKASYVSTTSLSIETFLYTVQIPPDCITRCNQKLPLHSAILIGQCLNQSSAENLPPDVDGNKYRGPELDDVKRVRDLGAFSPK